MSRIAIPAIESATGATAEVYAQVKKAAGGSIPNLFATLGYLAPRSLSAYLNAEGALSGGSLNRKDLETIKLLMSELTGCDYCVAAHSMLGKLAGFAPETLRQIRAGEPTGDAKRDALLRFVRLIKQTSGTLPAAEFDAIRAAGYTEAQLADIALAISLITFTNTFNRINDTDVDFPPVK
ncbi:carboxymuconolactone decarboxylase family protein [Bordetella genomosp. 11]|uniref:Alkylhydroperoxidase n=1 Tax=Bordetella genomosp. 11 TaxID=1416808 RepID=A0A261UKX8_9BORD|nr:carboxymuconolactone decarboxylase family protein [Bordetella genomosp. 11]OZI62022.1 alkylhydroperoxidase [Bordetella genomosp. 11]